MITHGNENTEQYFFESPDTEIKPVPSVLKYTWRDFLADFNTPLPQLSAKAVEARANFLLGVALLTAVSPIFFLF